MRLPGRHGRTLLHLAAERNHAGLCRWLLRLGSDVNRVDLLGQTPLHRAVRFGAAEAASLLVAHGADLDARDWQKRAPLDLAEGRDGEAAAQTIREEISLRHSERVKAAKMLRDQKRDGAADSGGSRSP